MPLPDVSEAFWDLQDTISFHIIGKLAVDHKLEEKEGDPVYFQGVIETVDPQKLQIKPEGQRQWDNFYLWTQTELENDMIVAMMDGKKFRILESSDWGTDGTRFFKYLCQENPLL
jgi:hypothetical protein